MSEFPERLKKLRTSKSLTQKQIANDIGLSESLYQYYEYGNREPAIGNFSKLCDYFQVSADYLLGRSESKERQP